MCTLKLKVIKQVRLSSLLKYPIDKSIVRDVANLSWLGLELMNFYSQGNDRLNRELAHEKERIW